MTVSASLLATAVVLCAVGGILMLTRPLTRILLGAVIASNGINLLVLSSTGSAGGAPLLYGVPLHRVTDPLPQAIALTAIVITLATTAFLLAMAYRSHQLTGTDEVHDDLEDRRIVLRAEVRGEWAELRARYRAESGRTDEERARYKDERRRLRSRLRADRALQARGRDASGDLWHDVLGADPEDYAQAGAPRPENAAVAADVAAEAEDLLEVATGTAADLPGAGPADTTGAAEHRHEAENETGAHGASEAPSGPDAAGAGAADGEASPGPDAADAEAADSSEGDADADADAGAADTAAADDSPGTVPADAPPDADADDAGPAGPDRGGAG